MTQTDNLTETNQPRPPRPGVVDGLSVIAASVGSTDLSNRGRRSIATLTIRWVRRHWPVAMVVICALVLVGVTLVQCVGYTPEGDHALMGVHVLRMPAHPQLVGVYSRFGFHHPGPALYQLLWVFSVLTGGLGLALPLAATAVNAGCLVGIVLVVERAAGRVAAALSGAVCMFYLSLEEHGFLRDAWNPYIALLPFVLGTLLAWRASEGRPWALTGAVALLSFSTQCHLAYAGPALLVLALVVALRGLPALARGITTRLRRGRARPPRRRAGRGWLAPLGVSAGVALVMWLPPLIEQATGRPGNLTLIWRNLTGSQTASDPSLALRWVGTQVSQLPAFLLGMRPAHLWLVPLPLWPSSFALAVAVALVVAVGAAVWLRTTALPRLAILTVLLTAAGVVSIMHVEGLLFPYVVEPIVGVAMLSWVCAAIAAVAVGRRLSEAGSTRWLRRASTAAAAAMFVVVSVLLVSRTAANQPGSDREVVTATRTALPVLQHYRGQTLCTVPEPAGAAWLWSFGVGSATVLQLRSAGLDVRGPAGSDLSFGPVSCPAPTPIQIVVAATTPPARAIWDEKARLLARTPNISLYLATHR